MANTTNVKKLLNKRAKLLSKTFILAIILLLGRTVYIQVVKAPVYAKEAMNQQFKTDIIKPQRGGIYDRNETPLAVSVQMKDLWIEVSNLSEEKRNYALDNLSEILKIEKDILKKRIFSDEKRFLVKKHLETDEINKIREAKIKGVWLEDSSKRVYLNDNFASYIIGHTSLEQEGLSGVESEYNEILKGTSGKKIILKNAKGEKLKELKESKVDALNSKGLILTIDSKIQHHVETEVLKALEINKAKRVTAIAIDPKTGDILAMTSKPDYNPNNPREADNSYFKGILDSAKTDEEKEKAIYQMWRNPAVNDVYEPGSPFKLITGAAAIEEGVTYLEDPFYDNGFIQVANRRIKNWRPQPFRDVTFLKSMEQSINTTFVVLGQRLGSERLSKYIKAFGFGSKTRIDLPGEGTGRIYPLEQMGPLELATTSFGQSISATPIQVLNAVSSIANDGKVMKPRVVKAYIDEKTGKKEEIAPEVIKQAVSKETANIILGSMESVVKNGSGKVLNLPQYKIGAKTGTAQKVINGKYERGYYMSSMVAVAPLDDPKIALIVIVDEPRGGTSFGSSTSGPVVSEIFKNVLPYLGVIPIGEETKEKVEIPNIKGLTVEEAIKKLKEKELNHEIANLIHIDNEKLQNSLIEKTYPDSSNKVPKGSLISLYVKYNLNKDDKIEMPDLTGMTLFKARDILDSIGIKFSHTGSGKIVNQLPKPGEIIDLSGYVSIELKDDLQEKIKNEKKEE